MVHNCYTTYQNRAADSTAVMAMSGYLVLGSAVLNTTILLFLLQDGITNGAIYALLGLALVLVFAVTRVILIPQGEFVTFGALTYALLAVGKVPGTVWLGVLMGSVAFAFDLWSMRQSFRLGPFLRSVALYLLLPLAILAITRLVAGATTNIAVLFVLSLVIVAPLGPYLYRVAYQ